MSELFAPLRIGRKLLISDDLNKNNFDFLRFFLAAAVIYSHSYAILYGVVKDTEPVSIFTHNQIDLGSVAVCFFFVISGFLIVKIFENTGNTWQYLVKRILRICPGFYVAFLVSLFVFGLMGTINSSHKFGQFSYYHHHMAPRRLALEFFTLEAPKGVSTFSTNPLPDMINEAFWTIQYEFTCYLLVPLLGIVSMMRRHWLAVVFFLLSFTVLVLQTLNVVNIPDNEKNWIFLYPSELPLLIALFFSGSCFYFYRNYIVRSPLLVLLSVIALLCASWYISIINLVLPIAGAYLVFYFAYHPGIRLNNFARRGDFSYGLYLYGWPVQQLIVYFFAKKIGPNQVFLIAFPITLVLAYLSWHLVEDRFLKMKRFLKRPALPNRPSVAGV
jgi:peptidoglycan/LPS O-acetylase OafA/YrhL